MKDDTVRGHRASPDRLTDEKLALDRLLEEASDSLECVRDLLSLRKTVGRNLRVAIRCLLDAHEKIEVEGPSTAARLDLLEAIRLIGVVEQELKGIEPTVLRAGVTDIETEPENRRAYRRLPAHVQIQLEPEHRAHRQDFATLSLSGLTMNLSRGGMLAKIDQGILRHGRYLIRFLEVSGAIQPSVTWGAVRRSRASDHGWEVGIEFDDPLETLK
ncbi:MAG: PilZ domain-containing protein [Acidobacteria bacterium]|nr:PilZ domain-containing protein [Acidobacteriota bacterium]